MRGGEKAVARFLLFLCVLTFPTCAQEFDPVPEDEEKPKPPAPAAKLDIKNSGRGSIPAGSSIQSGKWQVMGDGDELQVVPKPLVISWLEFGPEVREKGATILATGRSSGEGRLQSRFGAGLYGKNGFQLRLVPLTDEVELVRRQEVLLTAPMSLETDRLYTIELTAKKDEDEWVINGSVWEEGEDPEIGTEVTYRIYNEELLLPLAGRAVITGTPFSGEPVGFTRAELYPDGYIRKVEEWDDSNEEDSAEDQESN